MASAVPAERLAGLPVPWCIAAGWALDLFRGRQTRHHDDVEIAVPQARFAEVAERLPDVDFHVPVAGALAPASPGTLAAGHQTWALDRAAGRWRLDVFREPHDGDVWICRRNTRIRRSYADLIRHDANGLPFLVPEVVLLFKARLPGTRTSPTSPARCRSSTPTNAGGWPTLWRWYTRTIRGRLPSHPG